MCVSAIEMCLLTGILIPAIRAIVRPSTLSLLVARIRADHPNDAFAADDLAVPADPAYRSSHFHLINSRRARSSSGISARPWPVSSQVGLLQQTLVLVGHHVRLQLRHEIHRDHHDDQERRAA